MTALVQRAVSMLLAIVFYWRRREEPTDQEVDSARHDRPQTGGLTRQEPPPRAKPRGERRARFDMRLKTSILDHLEDNTKIVGRMKQYFPSEYGLYSQVGANIVPHDEKFLPDRADLAADPVSPWFLQVRPAFGAVVTGNPHDETKPLNTAIYPRLTHFLKVEQPKARRHHMFPPGGRRAAVQPIAPGSDFYVFTLYFDERDWARIFPKKTRDDWKMCKFYERAFALELPLEITKDGYVRPLRIIRDRYVVGRGGYSDVRRTVPQWDFPFSKGWIQAVKSTLTPQQYVLAEIGFALWSYESANASMIQVRASKDGVCTLVNVNVEQTPDFFNDRDDVIIEGIKKRIFHIVRPHERQVRNKTALVHLHFRGLRQFVWNGYQIEISVPGRDHVDVREFDLTVKDEPKESGAEMGEVAAWLVANQKSRFGAMVGKPGPLMPLRDFFDRERRVP